MSLSLLSSSVVGYVVSLLYEPDGGGWAYRLPNSLNFAIDPVVMKLLILTTAPLSM